MAVARTRRSARCCTTPPRTRAGIWQLREIRRRYGDEVAEIVDGCTDSYEDPPPPWRARKRRYIEHLPQVSPSALRVSLADKVDNVRTLLHDMPEQRPSGASPAIPHEAGEDVCWYYASLGRKFTVLLPGARADELSRLATELVRCASRN